MSSSSCMSARPGSFTARRPAMWRRDTLLLAIVLMVSLPSCSHGRSVRVDPSRVTTVSANDAMLERRAYRQINDYRARKRLRPLAWSEAIADEARRHSQRMARGAARFGHGGFEKRVKTISRSTRCRKAGENVAIDYSAEGAVEAWLKRRGHRKNIESDYDTTGIGAAVDRRGLVYFTQIFVKSR